MGWTASTRTPCATATPTATCPRLEARRQFDEIRVALSRSTDKLVLLEPPAASVLAELHVSQLPGHYTITWDSLLELLRTEEMSNRGRRRLPG